MAGDLVRLESEGGGAVIADILPRKNFFVRPPVANLDLLFVVAATVEPAPNFLVLDKMCAIALDKGVTPVLVATKTDLASPDSLSQVYARSGIEVLLAGQDEDAALEGLASLVGSGFSEN